MDPKYIISFCFFPQEDSNLSYKKKKTMINAT